MGEPASHLTTAFASKDLLGRDVRQVRVNFSSTPTYLSSKIAQVRLLTECARRDEEQEEEVT